MVASTFGSMHCVPCIDETFVIREQISYYRARALEYDDWFLRRGRYDRGVDATRRWTEQVGEVRDALGATPLDGKDVLELAPGTGIWTQEIFDRAARLTVVDASNEMIALNRLRLGDRARGITYVEADLFEWLPARQFDAVVFCFWISHVPGSRLGRFLQNVTSMLTPGGAVFFVDSRREPTSTAVDHDLPTNDEEVMTRRLDDGREFTVFKNFWSATALERECARAGLDVGVHETADYFQFGVGTRH